MTIDRLLLLPVGSCLDKGWGRQKQVGRGARDYIRKILNEAWPVKARTPGAAEARSPRPCEETGAWGKEEGGRELLEEAQASRMGEAGC